MTEPLFEFAFSDMLWKSMTSEDLEEMSARYKARFPPVDMRPNTGLIEEYAGIDGFGQGFKLAGIPTLASTEMWDLANKVRRDNDPDQEIISAYIGMEQGQTHPDDLIERYADIAGEKKIHYHPSPPCQKLTSAGNSGLTASERLARAKEGLPPIFNSLYTAQEMKKHPDINLNSWSMEQAKEAIPVMLDHPELFAGLDRDFKKIVWDILSGKGKAGTDQNPRMNAIDYGAPTTRNRMFIGEGWNKKPTHYKSKGRKNAPAGRLPNPTVLDILPHLAREHRENKGRANAKMQELMDKGNLTPEAIRILGDGPQVAISGAINPGNQTSQWRDGVSRNKQKRSFAHTYAADQHLSGLTHNRPAVMWDRLFTPEEFLAIQGFDPNYDLSSMMHPDGREITHETYTTGKRQKAIDTALGNVVVPPVSRAIGMSAFDVPPSVQRTLLEQY
jgi:site-specific DNA-cytosine methylase